MIRSAVLCLWFTAALITAGPVVKDEELCNVCSEALEFLEAGVKDQMLHAKTTARLEAVCSLMTPQRSDVCREVISGLTQKALSHLLANMEPMDLCRAMTACPTDMDVRTQHVPKVRSDSPTCELCELVVQYVDQYLNNTPAASINATVYKLCGDLPDTFKATCLQFAPMVVAILEKGVDPKQACTAIQLCSGADKRSLQRTYDLKDSPACELCELVVQYVDQYLNNTPAASINATVYKLCGDLPDTFKATCLQFAPMVVAILEKGVDPKQACTAIQLCSGADKRSFQRTYDLKIPQHGIVCEMCKLLVKTIDVLLNETVPFPAINASIITFCKLMPETVRQECLKLGPELVKLLSQGLDPEKACDVVRACFRSEMFQRSVENMVKQAPSQTVQCELCELLVTSIDDFLKENKTEAAINATVYKLCGDLPASLKSTCLSFAPQIVKILAQGVDPQQACTAIKMCTSSTEKEKGQRSIEIKVEQAPSQTLQCELCELLITALDDFLKENQTETAINATVYQLCGDLPDTLKSTCLAFAPQLVNIIVKGVDPKQACTAIKICTQEKEKDAFQKREEIEIPQHGIVCEMCKLLVKTIDVLLNETVPFPAINASIIAFCKLMPETVRQECLKLGPELVKLLSQGLDPEKACDVVRACFRSEMFQRSVENMVKQAPSQTVQCELCELLVTSIDDFLKENKTEAAINATVYKLCGDLPASLKSTCLSFAPQIVKILAQGVDPQQACTAIKMCTSSTEKEKGQRSIEIKVEQAPSQTLQCELCELLITALDDFLKENQTEAAINATVYQLCGDLPDTLKSTCLAFAPQLVNIIVKGVDPKQACTAIKICTQEKEKDAFQKREEIELKETPSQTLQCELCELLITALDDFLKENQTEAAINATVYQLCGDLPDTLKSNCLSFAPELVNIIVKGVDPKQACTAIKICTENETYQMSVEKKVGQAPSQTIECELCELLITSIDEFLKVNKTEAAINATVYKLCGDLPDSLKRTCLAFAPEIVKVLIQGVDPKQACTAIKMCTSDAERNMFQRSVLDIMLEQAPSQTLQCELCELLITALDDFLKENQTEAAINATVYQLCGDLPDTLKSTCLAFAPQLVNIIVKGVDPKQACTAIKICTSDAASQMLLTRGVPVAVGEDGWCTFCKIFFTNVDKDLIKEEEPLLKMLEDICHRLPPPTDQACLQAVDSEFPKIYEKFVNGTLSPDNVCKLLTICK